MQENTEQRHRIRKQAYSDIDFLYMLEKALQISGKGGPI